GAFQRPGGLLRLRHATAEPGRVSGDPVVKILDGHRITSCWVSARSERLSVDAPCPTRPRTFRSPHSRGRCPTLVDGRADAHPRTPATQPYVCRSVCRFACPARTARSPCPG